MGFESFIWHSEEPEDCPFAASGDWRDIEFTGRSRHYSAGDTWYPSWASDGRMYSPFTDGITEGVTCNSAETIDASEEHFAVNKMTSTGQAVMEGDDPENLKLIPLENQRALAYPYGGRYPCGSLVYNGVWYYGTYCLGPYAATRHGEHVYNWPQLGPFVGFRISYDYGKTWTPCPFTPEHPIFGENGLCGYPVKIGAPHFVDFGQNMCYSPDGKAYLIAHGSDLKFYPISENHFAHNSWITGDQIYLLRVEPTPESINDVSAYEFFAGKNKNGSPIWSRKFEDIQPLLEWPYHMGCVTVTYNAPLKRYFMAVTDGKDTCSRMDTYILESSSITGEWRLVAYLKNFGEQAYFVNFPSKFISEDGEKMWICYSGNFAKDWNENEIRANPPESAYGLVLQEIRLCKRRNSNRIKYSEMK